MKKYSRREFLGLAAVGTVLVVTRGVGLGGGARRGRVCGNCGAEVVESHEFEGRLYCPNCGAEWGRRVSTGAARERAVTRWGGVVFPHPARVRKTNKPVWRMGDLVL